ncbi:glucose-6-phosphate exchanger SLC37A1 isoform X2 [Nelusetta ayraudi]|uniref:glucose-6-phosphate exchanger SLC37A1 isoform X2 n=1 Tax=Nelusetta ayraudi TaxID=303726 RepID=UPI003F6FC140
MLRSADPQLQRPLGPPCIPLTSRSRPPRHSQSAAPLWCALHKPRLLLSQLWSASRPSNMAALPPGIRLLVSFDRNQWYKAFTLVLTFLLYTSFHLSRKPISIVKSELHKNCSPAGESATGLQSSVDCSWKPFDQRNYKQLLGAMDYSFLCAYAVGMYLSGIIGERLPIRLYLTVGMLSSGLFTCLFGLGYVYNIHSMRFYVFVQVANGLVQTTGWPSVVTCIGNWFGKGRRGLIMGLWNSHTSVGNILGSLIAGYWVSSNWGLSFIVPGLIIAAMGVVCFFFLIEHPNDLKSINPQSCSTGSSVKPMHRSGVNGHSMKYDTNVQVYCYDNEFHQWSVGDCSRKQSQPRWAEPEAVIAVPTRSLGCDTELLLPRDSVCVPVQPVVVVKREAEPTPISFMGALRIPGVVEFSLCLLFAKLVSYTFLFWLPLYITKAAHLDAKKAGDLSTLFDVGGIVGGILAGVVSDKLGKRASTCAVMLLLAAPTLYGFSMISEFGLGPTVGMLLVCGGLVNGPYALITTAVSADLGTHKSLKGNARALSTVTAIIDGTGSVGAALGPLLAGVLSGGGWNQVFYMLMAADFLALLLLLRLVAKELSSSQSHPITAVQLKEH